MRKVRHTSEFPFGIYWWILKNSKNQTFEKMKKIAGDIIILHMCNKNHNHIRYSSWDTKWDRIFCHFRPFFAPFTPSSSNNRQNQHFNEMKIASGDVIILNLCNKTTQSYDVCLLRYGVLAHIFFVISGHFLLFCHTIDPKN